MPVRDPPLEAGFIERTEKAAQLSFEIMGSSDFVIVS
jgi:hypothetical protein